MRTSSKRGSEEYELRGTITDGAGLETEAGLRESLCRFEAGNAGFHPGFRLPAEDWDLMRRDDWFLLRRNGTRAKTVLTGVGPVEVRVLREAAGSFEPQIVKERQRRPTGVDEMVLPQSAKGRSRAARSTR